MFKSLILIVTIAVTLSSCQKDIANDALDGGINVVVVSDGVVDYIDTKTAVAEGENGTYVKWLSDDAIDVYEAVDGSFQKFSSNSTTLKADLETGESDVIAEFNVIFGGDRSGNTYTYTAVYPTGAVSQGGNNTFYRFLIPATQELLEGNLSADSDVLIGRPINRTSRVEDGEKLSYRFSRPGTIVRMRLNGITPGEEIQKVTVTAPENVKLVGYSKIDLSTGTVTDSGYSNAGNTVVLKTNNLEATGDDYVYFRTLSCEWEANTTVSINVETNSAYYNKENINLTKKYVFAEGGLTAFGFNIADCRVGKSITSDVYELVTDASDLSSGDEIIIAVTDKKVALGTAYAKENEALAKVDIEFNGDGAIENVPMGVAVLTLGGSANAWTFENNGNYIDVTAEKKIKWAETAESWSISISDNEAIISTSSYGSLQYNASSPRFTTYTSEQTRPSIYKLQDSRIPLGELNIDAIPNHKEKTIKVEWLGVENAANYTVSCTGQESVEVNSGVCEYTFTGLEFNEYTVTVVANPKDGYKASKASKTVAIVDQTPSIEVENTLEIPGGLIEDGQISISFNNIDLNSVEIGVFSDIECSTENKTWLDAELNDNKTAIVYSVLNNDSGSERIAYIKVSATGMDGETLVTKVITVTQAIEEQVELEKFPYSESFQNTMGKFTVDNVILPQALPSIWTANESYVKATAYYSSKNYESESWLISPAVDLKDAIKPILCFDHTYRYGSGTSQMTLWAREVNGVWEQLTITNYGSSSTWVFVNNKIDISKYSGKDIQVAFKYTSTSTAAATWEIKNFSISEAPLEPCANPSITIDKEGNASISCDTQGAKIKYAVNRDETNQPELTNTYSGPFSVEDGDVVWAQATKDGYLGSEITHQKYTAGGSGVGEQWASASPLTKETSGISGGSANQSYGIQVYGNSTCTFTKDDYSAGIKTVTVHASTTSKGVGTITVQVGTTTLYYGSASSLSLSKVGNTDKAYEFKVPNDAVATGTVVVTVTASVNSLYFKQVIIN